MFKLDLDSLAPKLLQNREAHIDYLKYTQEQAAILRGIVEQAKAKQPLDNALDFSCKHAQRIQELLIYVRDTCPNAIKLSAKKVVATHKNNVKKLGLKCSTSNWGSKPTGNKNNDRISQTPSSSKKAKTVDSKNANHSKPNNAWGSNATNIPSSSSLIMTGTVRFRNDHIARIIGYGDYQLGNVTILRVYYVERLGHNLFSVGSLDINLYTISLDDMFKTSLICLLYKASKTKRWLWHRRLSHLNFACALGKRKKSSHQPKAKDINQEKLYLLHMDLCSLMRVASINGKRTKDEAPEAIIKCIKNIQVHLNATVCNIRTDNGTEFFNLTLREFYENVSISHQTFVARTPQQNGVVERYNKTPYELMQDKKSDISFFHVFGPLCYPTNDNDDLGKLDAKADIGSSSNVRQTHTPFEHLGRWTKDHPIANVIGDTSRFVSTRKKLQTDTMWCYFDAFLTSVEPKNFKQAMTELSWIDAMQEEIHEFERLKVWELVSCPDKVMLIKLKWIYKVKTNEFGEVLKNKARLVAQGFRQEKGVNLEESFASIARIEAIRIFIANAANKNMMIFQMDVKTAFLNSELKEEDTDMSLTAYADADHTGCEDTRSSTSGSALFLGDKFVSWFSKKQKSTAISSTEAEYIALSVFVIDLCCNNVQHSRAKHIDVRYHFIKEQVENRIEELYFVWTEYQLADIFTKPLPRERFNFLIEKLGMRSMSPEMLKRLTEEDDK
ncbi:retrovirus-related pol polyprotein from transposon TNT 1-94 [Tanacetum coccineum]